MTGPLSAGIVHTHRVRTGDLLTAVVAAEQPLMWTAMGQQRREVDLNVATDGDGYCYAWVVDIKHRGRHGWMPFVARPLTVDLLEPALTRLARVHDDDADVQNYDWHLSAPISAGLPRRRQSACLPPAAPGRAAGGEGRQLAHLCPRVRRVPQTGCHRKARP